MNWYQRWGQRAFDLGLAVPASLVLAPVGAVVALLVRLRLGAPVLFRQQRPGRDGVPFTLIKFRTMRDARAPDGRPLPDHERLTRFGQLLRSTSLDELPELWNVLKGEMSLVGPRPLLMRYLERYTPEQRRRHTVRPGLTGWAQIHGRNAVEWEARFALDVWYVEHQSLRLDGQIILRTLKMLLRREGISQPGQATMAEFQGTSAECE